MILILIGDPHPRLRKSGPTTYFRHGRVGSTPQLRGLVQEAKNEQLCYNKGTHTHQLIGIVQLLSNLRYVGITEGSGPVEPQQEDPQLGVTTGYPRGLSEWGSITDGVPEVRVLELNQQYITQWTFTNKSVCTKEYTASYTIVPMPLRWMKKW